MDHGLRNHLSRSEIFSIYYFILNLHLFSSKLLPTWFHSFDVLKTLSIWNFELMIIYND